MQEFISAIAEASRLVATLDADLFEIVGLSMRVSLTAVAVACLIGLPVGASLAIAQFPGRHFLIVTISALMGLPPVVVGLIIYLFLSNTGPLGWLELLYSPSAMIIAQTTLVAPIVAALSRQVIEDLNAEYAEQFRSLSVSLQTAIITLLWDARHSLATVALAGFGRAVRECRGAAPAGRV